MKRFVEGECRDQSVLFPERLDDWIAEDNPVRAVDALVDELDFMALGLRAPSRRIRGGRPTTPERCSRSISTATRTAFSRVAASSVRRSATWS